MNTTTSRRSVTARVLGVTALAVLAVGLSACSSGSGSGAATSSSAGPSTAVTTPTADTVVTETDVVTSTADVTHTERTTAGQNNGGGSNGNGGGNGGDNGTGGDDHSGSTPNPCPDPATLGTVTPNYDPQYPINSLNCSGEWAVGYYEADGKNQTTAIWRNSSGSWVYQDRAAVCAVAANLPPELYQQACSGS